MKKFLLSTILLFMLVSAAKAGMVQGTVQTAEGTPVSGVQVELAGTVSRFAITNNTGYYKFQDLPSSGFYVVFCTRANYSILPEYQAFSLIIDRTADFTATAEAVTASPLDTNTFFVREMYRYFLNREPDSGGLNFWSAQLNACNTNACQIAARKQLMCSFSTSAEYQLRFGTITHADSECN